MKTRLLLGSLVVAGCALAVPAFMSQTAVSAPEPSLTYNGWEFSFTAEKPRAILVTNSEGRKVWYWYVTFKVVNNTGKERMFVPEFVVSTDEGDIVPGGKDVPPSVYEAIKDDTGNKLLVSPSRAIGTILIGEDNARESVIVWPAFKHDITDVNLFIEGLSGETQDTVNPQTGEKVTLKKTLMYTYKFPGTGVDPAVQPVVVERKKWVMR